MNFGFYEKNLIDATLRTCGLINTSFIGLELWMDGTPIQTLLFLSLKALVVLLSMQCGVG